MQRVYESLRGEGVSRQVGEGTGKVWVGSGRRKRIVWIVCGIGGSGRLGWVSFVDHRTQTPVQEGPQCLQISIGFLSVRMYVYSSQSVIQLKSLRAKNEQTLQDPP